MAKGMPRTEASTAGGYPATEEKPAASGGGKVGAFVSHLSLAREAAADWTQDDLLDFTFLQAIKHSLSDDKALPIEASELYEKHMKPVRRALLK